MNMATGSIKKHIDLDVGGLTSIGTVSGRATRVSGGYKQWGKLIIINVVIEAVATTSNSPQVASIPKPLTDSVLSCIDITNGMITAIESSVPCGVNTDGKLFIKSIVTDHIYAISGVYVEA